MNRALLFGLLLTISLSFGQQRSTSNQPFVVDRTRFPSALQNVRLDHLSSGALMLLDKDGDLVRPSSNLQTRPSAAELESLAVALDSLDSIQAAVRAAACGVVRPPWRETGGREERRAGNAPISVRGDG